MYLIYFNIRHFIVFIVVLAVTTREYRKIEFSITWGGGLIMLNAQILSTSIARVIPQSLQFQNHVTLASIG